MKHLGLAGLSLWASLNAAGSAINVNLGTADNFAILAGQTITNTGTTNIINGNIGVAPGSAITGFPPGILWGGAAHTADAVALQAKNDLTTAYTFAAGEACQFALTGQDLGGQTLTPGVYCFTSGAQLTGALTLNTQGDPNAVFLFQIGSTLTTASSSTVTFINGGQGDNVFWQVGSSATLGSGTTFAGNILALTDIALRTGATIPCGRALARNGQVTLDTNTVSIDTPGCEAPIPEPGTSTLLGMSLLAGVVIGGHRLTCLLSD